MIDFNKKIINSNKFRLPALLFIKTGEYCLYPKGTTEYMKFWEDEMDKCINGYTADDGDFISGYNYFYLNYCPIIRLVYKEIIRNGIMTVAPMDDHTFPDFYDYDYYFFLGIDEAERNGKHMCVLKSRRKGFSFKGGAMACRNYYLLEGSKSYIYASNKLYLTDDGILTKAWGYMDFIDEHTAWGKKRSVNTQMRKRAGMFIKDEYGNEIEVGYKSEIIGVTLKDNPDIVRGKRGKLILFEEAGSFSELGAAWSIARPSVEQNTVTFGLMLAFGTGGDVGSNFATLKDMFYNPKGYNCLEFKNIWDENVTNQSCGFFCPLYTNLDDRDENGKRKYMDEDGNTITSKSVELILSERRKVIENATNSATIDRYVAERPISPAEAMLEFNGNIFPKRELLELLARIRTHKELKHSKLVGDLVWQPDGTLKWNIKKTGDVTHYPLKLGEDATGSIVIWEHPVLDTPLGLYIMGVDSYDFDESSTDSLGSCFVYKRFLNFENNYDIIVAEYTGRPATALEFYDNVRKLAIYYNARIMYENQNKGIFSYFTTKHCDYLLADSPDIINDVVGTSKVNRKKGCHMNKEIKRWGEGLIKDWLNDELSPGKKNLYNILSEPLLEELISYNDTGNFDRCLRSNTEITTDKGYKKVLDIEVGDKVLTDTGHYEKVIGLDSHMHNNLMAKIRLVGDYRVLNCTDNHPIYVASTDKLKHKYRKDALLNKQFLRADLLNYKYQFGLIPKRLGLSIDVGLSDDILYVLGWVMSDGYVDTRGNTIRITYQINQLDCAKKCLNIIEDYIKDEEFYFSKNNTKRIFRKSGRIFRYNNCWRLEVASKKFHNLCYWFGCLPNKKLINQEIYNKTSNLMPFIIGWLEGDGHQCLNINYDGYSRNRIELSTIYRDLIHQCRLILIDNGIYTNIRKVKQKPGSKLLYSISMSNEYINKLLDFYPSLKFKKVIIKKNTSKVLEDKDGFWVPIKLLELSKVNETVYNFEVDKDHTYIADGIVTHNCMAYMLIMIYREQLYNITVKEKKAINKNRVLFDGPIFVNNWNYDDNFIHQNNDNVYTFN